MKDATISIIVPALNEAELIQPFLRHLRRSAPGAEIIVVDGGSSDGTPILATGLCDRVISTDASRATQMNAGVEHARGDILWFLHVDCEVPTDCLVEIRRALDDPCVAAGYFRVRLPRPQWIYRIHDSFGHHLGVALRVRCGDHAIFCRRAAFLTAGGYSKVPLMEDVEFFRTLQRLGPVVEIAARIIVSTRRHEQVGPYRYTFVCSAIVALYCIGCPLGLLARIYKLMVPIKSAATPNTNDFRVSRPLRQTCRAHRQRPRHAPVVADL